MSSMAHRPPKYLDKPSTSKSICSLPFVIGVEFLDEHFRCARAGHDSSGKGSGLLQFHCYCLRIACIRSRSSAGSALFHLGSSPGSGSLWPNSTMDAAGKSNKYVQTENLATPAIFATSSVNRLISAFRSTALLPARIRPYTNTCSCASGLPPMK